MDKFSSVGNQEQEAIDDLYQVYLENPESLDKSWQHFFAGFELARTNYPVKQALSTAGDINKEFAILSLIHGYRQRGHLFTKTNPVRTRRKYTPTLDIENFGFDKNDLETTFQAGNDIGIGPAKLKDIVEHLEATYCHSIGVEFIYIRMPEVLQWLKDKMENSRNSEELSDDARKDIFYHLKLAVGFESFIHKKFVGQKRFSLEGAESLIPALDAVIERGAELGIEEFVLGLAHRGRLNVLANILEKPYENIFKEFYGKEYEEDIWNGDVKYHLGYENEVQTDFGKKVKLKLMPNPSHLEAVGPIVQGMVRSRINSMYESDYSKAAGIIIHGDAAIAAQGVVYETIQMSQLDGYRTGGTIHLIINNQVGFTTPYVDARSSTYCTDVTMWKLWFIPSVWPWNSVKNFKPMCLSIFFATGNTATTKATNPGLPSPCYTKPLKNIRIRAIFMLRNLKNSASCRMKKQGKRFAISTAFSMGNLKNRKKSNG